MHRLFAVALIAMLGMSGCSQVVDQGQPEKQETLPRELSSHEKQLVDADGSFSYDIFRRTVARDSTGNVFISPLSISMVLGLTLNGAAGETKAGMKEALRLQGLDQSAINESYASLIELLRSADSKVTMQLANAIWIRKGFSVQEAFKENGKKYFDARIESMDFSDPATPETINEWVRDKTEGRIDKLIESGIPAELVMYLVNAIYFKGNWRNRFDPKKTSQKDFFTGSTSVRVPMMTQENPLKAYVSDKVKMLDLSYGNSLFTMTLMMPASSETPVNDFIREELTAENMDYWIDHLTKEDTEVELPKFELEYGNQMNEVLKAMGMGQAFDSEKADFSNINPMAKLYLSEVKQKAFIKVDEKGTEAAAATSVGVRATSAGPGRTLKFDRPFVFVIRERTSGTILFMGKVKDPS